MAKKVYVRDRAEELPARIVAPATPIDVSNLPACTEEAKLAALDMDSGPEDAIEFDDLRARLSISRERLPPLYRVEFADPYIATINALGRQDFQRILLRDPTRERTAGLMLDLAHAILQNGENFQSRATDGFQEVVADLYDGFLSAQSRGSAGAPDVPTTAPLVKWGNPSFGPYTWPITATRVFGVNAAVVSLPPSNSRRGLLAWSALGHETAGHDILHANVGLEEEVSLKVDEALRESGQPELAEYWSARISETASDVLGILNMGPAAALGLIGYFRGLNAAFNGSATLRNSGPDNDPHPADIVRAFLGAATVRHLSFHRASEWADVIDAEGQKDVGTIRLAGEVVDTDVAIQSARKVAEVIATAKLETLDNRSFISIQDWRDRDETAAEQLCRSLTSTFPIPPDLAGGIFAAHVVAAATYCGVKGAANLEMIFDRMAGILKIMHDANASWGPLFVRHPSNIERHFHYLPEKG